MSLKLNGLVHRYCHLGPEERFRAAMEAGARDDRRELERLVQSCSRLVYTCDEFAFTDRVDVARTMAIAVALDLGPRLAKLKMVAAVRETLPHAVAIGVDAGAEEPGELTPEDVSRIVEETLGRAFDKAEDWLRSQAAAVLAAFGEVAREHMGLEPEVVLRSTLGPLLLEQLDLSEVEGAEPDEEALAAWREMFARKWRDRVG